MQYRHLDLTSYEIRMLVINDTRDDGMLQCTLEHTSLVDPGPYSALSYRWSEPFDTTQIILNDCPVEIGVNLEAALQQLHSHGHKRIWADALCINQNDLEERGLQVRNMQLIYSKAINVVAWIGNDEENIATAVKYLLETRSFEWLPARRWTAYGLPSAREMKRTKLRLGVDSSIGGEWMQQRWRIFGDFFSLDYWKRVWVIQELASGSEVKVIFGKTEISWNSISRAASFLRAHSKEVPKTCQSYENASRLQQFRYRFLSSDPAPITLHEALQWSHYAEATDPRDKIYALLGLTSDGHKIIPLPNYQQSLEQIHEIMTRNMFAMERSLRFICMRGLGCHEGGQASWAPDWAYYWSRPRTILEDRICQRETSSSAIPIFIAQKPRILETEGSFLGAVCSLSSSLTPTGEVGARLSQRIELDENDQFRSVLSQRLQNNYPSGIADALSRILCLDQLNDFATHLEHHFRSLVDCFYNLWEPEFRKELQGHPLLQWLDENASLDIGLLTLKAWAQSQTKTKRSRLKRSLNIWQPSYDSGDQGRYKAVMSEVLQGSMVLMVTQTGFIGLAHPATQIGDMICYIKGCTEAVVLRKRETPVTESSSQQYQVIGGAYIQVEQSPPGNFRFDKWAENHFNRVQRIILA